jgi:hypothetical protein
VRLPEFGIEAYEELLDGLSTAGYRFAPVGQLPRLGAERTVLLRHDVDLDPPSTLAMAELEAMRGIAATYYVPITVSHFNALDPVNGAAVRRLRELGHEIGLHYDLRTYPEEPAARRAHLDWELAILEGLVGAPVRTLCMHQPSLSPGDPFQSLQGLVHPHDPALQDGLLYVSDSARAWRDDALLRAFDEDPPTRLLLLVHPESWLDPAIDHPLDYVEQVLVPLGIERVRSAYEEEARAWSTHPTARARA